MTANVILMTRQLPRDATGLAIRRQIIRSVGSVGANIAEGHGRYTLGAYKNHLSIAKGSACETDSWIDLLRRIGFISSEVGHELHGKLVSLIAVLTSKIRYLESRIAQSPRMGEEPVEYAVGDGGGD